MYVLHNLILVPTCKVADNFDTELRNHHVKRGTVVVAAADAAAKDSVFAEV